jgi:hypothetical protein
VLALLSLAALVLASSSCSTTPAGWPLLPPAPEPMPPMDSARWTLEGERATLPQADLVALTLSLHEWIAYARALEAAGHWRCTDAVDP